MNICKIPVSREQCEEKRIKCLNCEYKDTCDMYWVSNLWEFENKQNGANSLLGPCLPTFVKPDMRKGHIISVTGQEDFCLFNNPKTRSYVTISDIYVDPELRGQHISNQIFSYLFEKYHKDIFAKCVRDSSAESFWRHVGVQVDANAGKGPDLYEHRNNKRDLGWYMIPCPDNFRDKASLW